MNSAFFLEDEIPIDFAFSAENEAPPTSSDVPSSNEKKDDIPTSHPMNLNIGEEHMNLPICSAQVNNSPGSGETNPSVLSDSTKYSINVKKMRFKIVHGTGLPPKMEPSASYVPFPTMPYPTGMNQIRQTQFPAPSHLAYGNQMGANGFSGQPGPSRYQTHAIDQHYGHGGPLQQATPTYRMVPPRQFAHPYQSKPIQINRVRQKRDKAIEKEAASLRKKLRNEKSLFTYPNLTFLALLNAPGHQAYVHEVYDFLLYHFPFFQNTTTHWRNSIRHNLAKSPKFVKIRNTNPQLKAKGDLWSIHPDVFENMREEVEKIVADNKVELLNLRNPDLLSDMLDGRLGIPQPELEFFNSTIMHQNQQIQNNPMGHAPSTVQYRSVQDNNPGYFQSR